MLPDQSASRPARHLLLVEDEPLVQQLVVCVLEDAGFSVIVANDGVEALELLETNAESLRGLISDINLGPGADSWAVARRAREDRGDLPVVYLSGVSCHEWASMGVPHSLMMVKPFEPAQIVAAISSLLAQADPTF